MVKSPAHPALWLWAMSCPAQAAQAVAPNPLSAASMLQVAFGLVFVLAIFGGAAWLMKRLNALPRAGSQVLRMVGGIAIGTRERVVVLEIQDTWLVVGIAPGHIAALHTLPRLPHGEAAPAPAGFASQLRQILERRPHG
ncbi:MAG TPA: flagellar biosynthetic protein FliO [Burkholderiales bacterium]|nr:flagellar biosynthetic protein FliO [Burkholderiales bacterium]